MSDDATRPVPAPRDDRGAPLRRRAEEVLGSISGTALKAHSPEEIQRLVHELQVHQIELELQNEELRRTQEELEAARSRYFELYDLAPVGYVTLSAQGLIQEANLTVATILQVHKGALIKQPITRFILPEDQDCYYQHQRRLTTTGAPQVCELRLQRATASPFWGRLEATAAQDSVSGEPIYRTVISDITARVEAEARLRDLNATLERRVAERTAALSASENSLRSSNAELAQALQLKDEFLAMMSHELRTPLNTILGFTEALTEEIYGPILPRQRQIMTIVMQSGRHLLDLISDILDLTRISVGQEHLDLRPVAVDDLCQTALLFVRPAAAAKHLRLLFTIQADIRMLHADERRLTQILVNLLSNAVKFTPAAGSVGLEVTANAAQAQIQFSVWDTGIGIAPADQQRLFEPFTQVDQQLSRQYEGVGLGLALVRRLTELHGGAIQLESTPGIGSRFTVSLPWTADANTLPARAPQPEGNLPHWSTPPRIVLADDHEPTLIFYTELLTRQGCQVTTAQTGEQALAQVRATHPDVVVLDIQMPGMDGLAATRHIRADPSIAHVPIIALTALVMPGDRERCLAAGATAYLAKPVSLHTLLTTITEALGTPDPELP